MQTTIPTTARWKRRSRLNNAIWRVRQFGYALWSQPDPAVDADLQQLLGSGTYWHLLERLTPFDRAHHLRVHNLLVADGHDDPDLLLAALLHDVGKADERGRVTPFHRAIHVLLSRIAPATLRRLADHRRGFRHGLWLSVHHAELGAELVRMAGGSERCCALIAAHDDPDGVADPLLAALVAADDAAIR